MQRTNLVFFLTNKKQMIGVRGSNGNLQHDELAFWGSLRKTQELLSSIEKV